MRIGTSAGIGPFRASASTGTGGCGGCLGLVILIGVIGAIFKALAHYWVWCAVGAGVIAVFVVLLFIVGKREQARQAHS